MKLSEFLEEHKVEEVNLKNVMLCEDCKEIFVWHDEQFNQLPKRCPSCIDKKQLRPSIVVERLCTVEFDGITIESLPSQEWEKVESGVETDYPCFKISVKGSRYGRSWSGRIDIFADKQYKPGDSVKIRVMESRHLVKKLRYQSAHIQRSPFDPPTHTVEKTIPITSKEESTDANTISEEVEERQYLYLSEVGEEAGGRKLIWRTSHSKTTLKGFGRQYHASLNPEATLWSKSCSGGVRSGRASTEGVLAIVEEGHPLIYTFQEGTDKEVEYIE